MTPELRSKHEAEIVEMLAKDSFMQTYGINADWYTASPLERAKEIDRTSSYVGTVLNYVVEEIDKNEELTIERAIAHLNTTPAVTITGRGGAVQRLREWVKRDR